MITLRYLVDVIKQIINLLTIKKLVIGQYSYGKPKVVYYGGKEKAIIGKFCSIGDKVTLILVGNHQIDWMSTYPFPAFFNKWPGARQIPNHVTTKGNIVVGNDVWIGYGATILAGVKIGDGAVVGAMSVVTKDVRPYEIVAGNPARVIRKRFNEVTIRKLLALKWWDWSKDKIQQNINLICSDQFNSLIQDYDS